MGRKSLARALSSGSYSRPPQNRYIARFAQQLLTPMESSILTDIFLPASLFVIMLGMGLSLVVADFRRVFAFPKAAAIGLTNQLLVVPLVSFGLCHVFALPNELAIGMMLIAACPGGVTSNLISHVSRGDTALSISLTAMSSLITLVTIPLFVGFAFRYFNDTGKAVDVDELGMVLQILVIVIIPVAMGMVIRARSEAFARRMDRPVRIFSVVLFVAIVVSIVIREWETIVGYFPQIGGATVTLNVLTLLLGYYSAILFRLRPKQAITIAIESGIQNGTLAIVIAATVLADFTLSIPAGIYSLIMFISGGVIMYWFGRERGLR
ncbi:MAG: bile acid:sodium symporter family protein [Saprospiraceae bacterium]|nr:bile acid:sodium symporter family protein [Saprospiraceae bacterium]